MCPGSHIRRVRGATPGRGSPEVQALDGPIVMVEVGWLRGASNPRGRSVKRTLQRRHVMPPRASRAWCAECSMPTVEFESAEPLTTWRRPVPVGKESDMCTHGALRRRGVGTEGRIDGSKRGRSVAQPIPGRMAKTRRITEREVDGRVADWRLRPYERRRRGQHNLARAKGLWASAAAAAGKAGRSAPKGYHAPGRIASIMAMSVGAVAKAACQPGALDAT